MEKENSVIVGTGIGGQRNIIEALSNAGLQTSTTEKMWPRDHYVNFQNRYVKNSSPGSIDGNAFGEGGNILIGEDFLLVSDLVYLREATHNRLPKNPTHEQIFEAIRIEGAKQFPEARIHIAPSGYFHGRKGHSHIDMFSLLLPQNKFLLIDTHYGKSAGKAKEYDTIAEIEGLKLIRYDGSQDGVWYPLNSLNISRNGKEIVLVDEKAKSLVKLLKDVGAEALEVAMPQHEHPAGKIRCQTNTYKIYDNIERLLV